MVAWKIGLWRRQSPPFQQIRQHFVRFLFEGESCGRSAGNVVGKNRVSCYCQGQERKRVPYYCLLMLLLQQQQRNVRHWFLLRFQIWCHSIQLSISGIILPNLVSVHFKLYQHLHCCVPLTAKLFLALQNLTSTPDSVHVTRTCRGLIQTRFCCHSQTKLNLRPMPTGKYKAILIAYMHVVQSVRQRFENESNFDKLGLNEAACASRVDWMLYFFGNGLFGSVIKVQFMY